MNFVDSLSLFHVDAKEIPCLTGKGAPTAKTEGAPGVLYMDTDSGVLYKCRAADPVNEVYTWEEAVRSDSSQNVELDTTLTADGKAADAKAVGDALASKLNAIMVSPDGSKWRIGIGNDGVMISEKIIIEFPATGITLSASALTFDSSANQTIKATLNPADSTDVVVWKTSNPDVATVSNGVVTPIGNGSCTITATAGAVSASCAITVDVAVVETYAITRNITNATGFDDSAVIGKGSELLECFVSNDECTMDGATATVTMGGVDITETAWDNGVVNIAEVTGDVVITLDAVKIQYVVPPIEDFSVQVHEGALLLKGYTGTEKAIELPTAVTYNGTVYTAEANKLKLYALVLSSSVEHFKDPGLAYFSSRYKNTGSTKTFLAKGDFITAKGNTNLEKPPISKATDLPVFKAADNSNFNGTAFRTVQQVEYPTAQTSLAWLYNGCLNLVDGGTIPPHITDISRTFNGCTNLRKVRIEAKGLTSYTDAFYGVAKLKMGVYPDTDFFKSMRYNPSSKWEFMSLSDTPIHRVSCFGDSLSEWTYEDDMLELCADNVMVTSLGNGGYNSKQIYQKMVDGTYVSRLKNDIVVIWHGTNGYGTDGYDGVTAKMVAALEGNQRYLLIPPTAQGEGDEVYESWKASYGEEHVLSIGDWFANNGYTVSDYQTDGTHFTADGYALVAQAIYEKIQNWL